MSRFSWAPHVLAIELKKVFSYRLDFWIKFLLSTATELGVAYCLWKAIYEYQGQTVMAGFTFKGIIFYYLFALSATRIGRGDDHGYLAGDIYDGGLTRYLLYPLSFLGYKYVTHFSQQLMGIVKLSLAFVALMALVGLPEAHQISVGSYAAGGVTCLLTGFLYFFMASCLELVAFWQDVVWNLLVMLRFIATFLGGAMIPLSFFPAWARAAVMWTPFPALITFPTKTFLGEVTLTEWFANIGILALWSLVFYFLSAKIWARGLRQYSGVGI